MLMHPFTQTSEDVFNISGQNSCFDEDAGHYADGLVQTEDANESANQRRTPQRGQVSYWSSKNCASYDFSMSRENDFKSVKMNYSPLRKMQFYCANDRNIISLEYVKIT